jgi:hypothetical protein
VWWSAVNNSQYFIKLRLLQAIEVEKEMQFSIYKTEWDLSYERIPVSIGAKKVFPFKKYWLMGTSTPKVLALVFLILWLVLMFYAGVRY